MRLFSPLSILRNNKAPLLTTRLSLRPVRHRLTGWNAVKSRVEQLKLEMTDEQIKDATNKIKELADVKTQTMEDVDVILRVYHKAVTAGVLEVGDGEKLDELLDAHRCVLPLSLFARSDLRC